MKKTQTNFESAHQIIMDVSGACNPKKKKTKKNPNLTETDVDIFAADEGEK